MPTKRIWPVEPLFLQRIGLMRQKTMELRSQRLGLGGGGTALYCKLNKQILRFSKHHKTKTLNEAYTKILNE